MDSQSRVIYRQPCHKISVAYMLSTGMATLLVPNCKAATVRSEPISRTDMPKPVACIKSLADSALAGIEEIREIADTSSNETLQWDACVGCGLSGPGPSFSSHASSSSSSSAAPPASSPRPETCALCSQTWHKDAPRFGYRTWGLPHHRTTDTTTTHRHQNYSFILAEGFALCLRRWHWGPKSRSE